MTLEQLWEKVLLFLISCGCMQERRQPLQPVIERRPMLPMIPTADEADDWDSDASDPDRDYVPVATPIEFFGIHARR